MISLYTRTVPNKAIMEFLINGGFMKKNNLIVIIFSAIFIVGIITLMNSIKLGDNEVSGIMKINGGSMDTNTFLIYLEQSITKYRFIGSILSVLGGLGILKNTK
jgi:hypothetical protein